MKDGQTSGHGDETVGTTGAQRGPSHGSVDERKMVMELGGDLHRLAGRPDVMRGVMEQINAARALRDDDLGDELIQLWGNVGAPAREVLRRVTVEVLEMPLMRVFRRVSGCHLTDVVRGIGQGRYANLAEVDAAWRAAMGSGSSSACKDEFVGAAQRELHRVWRKRVRKGLCQVCPLLWDDLVVREVTALHVLAR